jgi:hypothetical protein
MNIDHIVGDSSWQCSREGVLCVPPDCPYDSNNEALT